MVVNNGRVGLSKGTGPVEPSQSHAQGQSATRQDAKSRTSRSADPTPENQPRRTTAPPGQSPGYPQINHSLGGRREKRLPIIVVVRLSRMRHLPTSEEEPIREEERTRTDNLSAHGARVYSRRLWQPGEKAQVTPLKEETPMRGEVVYCQRLDSDNFCIGLKFQEPAVTWSILHRYGGN
jgi:PilZ domain-containing protein